MLQGTSDDSDIRSRSATWSSWDSWSRSFSAPASSTRDSDDRCCDAVEARDGSVDCSDEAGRGSDDDVDDGVMCRIEAALVS